MLLALSVFWSGQLRAPSSAFGRCRSCDLQLRKLVLFPLSYECLRRADASGLSRVTGGNRTREDRSHNPVQQANSCLGHSALSRNRTGTTCPRGRRPHRLGDEGCVSRPERCADPVTLLLPLGPASAMAEGTGCLSSGESEARWRHGPGDVAGGIPAAPFGGAVELSAEPPRRAV